MKTIFLLLCFMTIFFRSVFAEEQDYDVNYFPGTTTKAPDWIFGEPVAGWEISSVGEAEKTSGGLAFQKQKAITAARVQLVQQMKTYLANMIEDYVGVSGKPTTTESVDAFTKSVTSNISEGSLVGSKLVKTVYGPDGTLWVLVAIDNALAESIARKAMQTSFKNGIALHQQSIASESQTALIDAIVRRKVADQSPQASDAVSSPAQK